MTPKEKPGGGSRTMARAENRDAGRVVHWEPDQSTPTSKKRPAETPSPATRSERVPPKGGMESYAHALESSGLRVAIFREGYSKTQLTKEDSKEVRVTIRLMLWDRLATGIRNR